MLKSSPTSTEGYIHWDKLSIKCICIRPDVQRPRLYPISYNTPTGITIVARKNRDTSNMMGDMG
jgi:hypothetical protein